MTINEYRAEMEQKLIRMEASLKKAQLEGQQRTHQVNTFYLSINSYVFVFSCYVKPKQFQDVNQR